MQNPKLKKLENILRKTKRLLVAYSGGCDSSFLAKFAADALGRENVITVTATSPTYTKAELRDSKKLAKKIGIRHIVIRTSEIGSIDFNKNPYNRCYFCKKELFKRLRQIAKRHNIRHIADGSNLDDLRDYRPGSKAKKEFGIISPLQEAKLTKEEIRQLSKKAGLGTWNKPALACLASRIPYGEKIMKDKLRLIEKAEEYLTKLGLKQVRVRLHKDIARIEVPRADINRLNNERLRSKIAKKLKTLGFSYITLDLEGYRTGSMNEVF